MERNISIKECKKIAKKWGEDLDDCLVELYFYWHKPQDIVFCQMVHYAINGTELCRDELKPYYIKNDHPATLKEFRERYNWNDRRKINRRYKAYSMFGFNWEKWR